jgi:hypothetical protein
MTTTLQSENQKPKPKELKRQKPQKKILHRKIGSTEEDTYLSYFYNSMLLQLYFD